MWNTNVTLSYNFCSQPQFTFKLICYWPTPYVVWNTCKLSWLTVITNCLVVYRLPGPGDVFVDTEDIEDDAEFQPPTVADSSLRAMRRNYIRFLNEAYRAGQGEAAGRSTVGRRRPSTHYMSPLTHQRLVNSTSIIGRQRRSPIRRRRRTCQRHEMYVDFEKIGWSGWIISPKGYNAYQCRGVCPFPLGQNQHPSNHATVQSIVHALRIGGGLGEDGRSTPVDTPCCVPNKLYSISLLYFDDEENVILKQYDEMVALNCGCH